MKRKAVLFDLDGTLIDSTEAIVQSFMHTFDAMGEPRPPRDAVVTSIGHILEDQFAQMTHRNPDECTRIYREHYAKTCCDLTFLLPGGAESLRALAAAGLRLGFATSKRRLYAEMILEHLGVLDMFEVRIGPDDVANPKPAPDAVLRALELFELNADEVILIGDTHFDVDCARAAGVDCICVTTGYETRDQLEALQPLGVYDSLLEISKAILKTHESVA